MTPSEVVALRALCEHPTALAELVKWQVRGPCEQYAYSECRYCHATWWDREQHNLDCIVEAARKELALLLWVPELLEENERLQSTLSRVEQWRQTTVNRLHTCESDRDALANEERILRADVPGLWKQITALQAEVARLRLAAKGVTP